MAMEQIHKALQKSKQARSDAAKKAKDEPAPQTALQSEARPRATEDQASQQPAKPATAAERPKAPPSPGHSQIKYKQTRTERADPSLLAEHRVIAGLKHDPRSAVFQILRTQVLMALRRENWNSIAVTSPTPNCGKTFMASNLAVAIAQEVNQTVLLLDMDLRMPKVAEYFGVKPEFGLRDFLIDDVPLSKIFVNPGLERLVIMPGRGTIANSSEMLSMPKTIDLVNEIKTRYASRIVIFDLPPLLPTDDALVCLQQVDSALLIVEDGKTTEDEVVRSLRMLDGVELMGTILNKSNSAQDSYYYYS